MKFVDVNVSFGPWPFCPLTCETVPELAKHLDSHGISQALVSPLRAVFYDDPHPANLELLFQSAPFPQLLPIPTLNPSLANCLKTLRIYQSQAKIVAVKLYPNFHHYTLTSKRCLSLLTELERQQIPLILNIRLEDERHFYRGLKLGKVSLEQTKRIAQRFPELKLLCLGLYRDELPEWGSALPQARFDLSFADWHRLIPGLLESLRPEQLLFGSHTPLMVTEANRLKLETSPISNSLKEQIASQNAEAFFELFSS